MASNPEAILQASSFNVTNDDSQAGNKLVMQESMILPAVVSSVPEAMVIGKEVYQNLKKVIKEKYRKNATNVSNGDRFAPNIMENKEAMEVLKSAIAKAGHTVISIEVAAFVFFRSCKYDLDFKSLARHI
ncbi:Eno1 [Lemmus lemmus]